MSRSTVCRFVAKYDDLRILIDDITEEMTDVAESQLMIALRQGKEWAVKYWLNERGQSRGYNQRRLAFRDGEGNVQLPATLVAPGRMTEDEWAASDWANAGSGSASIQ